MAVEELQRARDWAAGKDEKKFADFIARADAVVTEIATAPDEGGESEMPF